LLNKDSKYKKLTHKLRHHLTHLNGIISLTVIQKWTLEKALLIRKNN